MAAVTHGLTSRRVLLGNESKEEFLALRELLVDHFQPSDPYEADMVEQLIAARWRLDRVQCLETALLEIEINRREPQTRKEFQSCGPDIRNALAFRALFDESRVLAGLSRYESRFRRACDKLTKRLDSLRAIRKLHEEPSAPDNHPQPPDPTHVVPQDVAQALKPAASALEPTPGVPPQPPSPTAKRTSPVFATGDEPRAAAPAAQQPATSGPASGPATSGPATSDERPRQRPPEVALW